MVVTFDEASASVRTVYPNNWRGNFSYNVDYDITMPATAPLDLRNRFGNTDVSNLQAAATINSGNGSVNNVDTSTFNSAAQAAINMSNVTTASFTNLSVTSDGTTGGAQVGINGNIVSGFTLANSTVSGFGDAAQEGDVKLWNLTGTCSVSNSSFSFVTGESVPVNRILGEIIYAGGRQTGETAPDHNYIGHESGVETNPGRFTSVEWVRAARHPSPH